jgi:hypothetical protein
MAIRESIFLDSIPANPTAEIIAILAAVTPSSRRDELIRPDPLIGNGARDTSGRSPHAVAASSPISRGPGPGPSRAIIARPIDGGLTPFGARLFRERDHDEDECDARHGHSGRGIAGSVERTIGSCLISDGGRRSRSCPISPKPDSTAGRFRGGLGSPRRPLTPRRPWEPPRPNAYLRCGPSPAGSFGEPTDDPSVLYAWLVRNVERLIEELEYHEVRTGRVTTWVGYRDGRAGEGHSGLVTPSNRFDDLLDAFRPCLRQAWIPRAPASRMLLFADRLTPAGETQLALFDRGDDKAARIAALKKGINDRHGRFVLRSAVTLPLFEIYKDKANEYDICDVRGKVCF